MTLPEYCAPFTPATLSDPGVNRKRVETLRQALIKSDLSR